MERFERLTSKTKTYLVIVVLSCLLTLFFGFNNSGSVTYRGNDYDAGSVFRPNNYSISGFGADFDKNYGEFGKSFWGDPEKLNTQLKKLRGGNLGWTLIFGISTLFFAYLLWKDEEIFSLLQSNTQ